MSTMPSPWRSFTVVGVAVAAVVACSTTPVVFPADPPPTALRPIPPAPLAQFDALDALGLLAVKGRAPRTGYDRDQFGPAWADVDRTGCDQRNDVLRRDMPDETLKPGSWCIVLSGTLTDPYTGKVIEFERGQDTSSAVQIDHVVALSNAWQTGAQALTADERRALANDLLNLIATDGPTNQQKSDADYATWKPPVRAYWCTYAARIVAVRIKHRLWVTPPERDALADTLSTCPNEPVPSG